jgi:two-component system, NtrC family, sensor kinase
MKADKTLRKTGTVCITDHPRKQAEQRGPSMQSRSGPYVMPHSPKHDDLLEALMSTQQISTPKDALKTLRTSQKLIHLGRTAASIAHEVNNPLESITNLLYLIRLEPGLPANVLGYLELAEQEMERVVSISKQTLNFARETSEPVDVSMPEILDEVLVLYRHLIDQKQIEIVKQYEQTDSIRAFPGEMRQIFANLIVNAMEACDERGVVTLRVRPAFDVHQKEGLRVTVADNGTGIPPEVRRRLGEPFFTTKGQSGTGLGLWVTRSIIERYGGRLRMRSVHVSEPRGKINHGTVFTLRLPFETKENTREQKAGCKGPVLVSSKSSKVKRSHPSSHSSIRRTANRD